MEWKHNSGLSYPCRLLGADVLLPSLVPWQVVVVVMCLNSGSVNWMLRKKSSILFSFCRIHRGSEKLHMQPGFFVSLLFSANEKSSSLQADCWAAQHQTLLLKATEAALVYAHLCTSWMLSTFSLSAAQGGSEWVVVWRWTGSRALWTVQLQHKKIEKESLKWQIQTSRHVFNDLQLFLSFFSPPPLCSASIFISLQLGPIPVDRFPQSTSAG